MINVFVSRPNWTPEPFKEGLDIFLRHLISLGLNSRTLGATDYPTKAPLDEVIKLMSDCKGAVILGYPQIEIASGKLKGKILTSAMLLPTEWNHIEAGLAYARNLPLLVIHHTGVCRGIFDRGALNSFLFCKNLSDSNWANDEDISGAIRSWRNDVLGYSPTSSVVLNEKHTAIAKYKDAIWTVEAVGRKIKDTRPLGAGYKESAECSIIELSDFYVRIKILSSDEHVTIPYQDFVVSYDDRRQRPKLQIRVNGT